ncbi:MAG: hypothetical protein M3O02_13330 [Acidobacteriota bacterium]|nr:hypothetical protein [Acidobacteriota bacterium]
MEMEFANQLAATIERLAAASGLLEQAVERFHTQLANGLAASHSDFAASAEAAVQSTIERIVATVDATRDSELAAKLDAAEQRIAELEARAASPAAATGRKTLPAIAHNLFSKHGMSADSIQAGALDAALVHLSLEQRIAVKAELMRAGMLG